MDKPSDGPRVKREEKEGEGRNRDRGMGREEGREDKEHSSCLRLSSGYACDCMLFNMGASLLKAPVLYS